MLFSIVFMLLHAFMGHVVLDSATVTVGLRQGRHDLNLGAIHSDDELIHNVWEHFRPASKDVSGAVEKVQVRLKILDIV